MTSMWPEDSYASSDDYDDSDGEGVFDDAEDDVEDDDAEASAYERRRQERLRRMRARQKQRNRARIAASGQQVVPARPTAQQAVTAIRNLDVDNKIQDERFRKSLAALQKSQRMANWASAGTAVVAQVLDSFNKPENDYLRALLRLSPQFLTLTAPQRGVGFAGYIGRNPVIPAAVVVAGITFAGKESRKSAIVNTMSVDGPSKMEAGGSDLLTVEAFDVKGRRLSEPVVWRSSDEEKASVGATSGVLLAKKPGFVRVFAKIGDVEKSFQLEVIPKVAAATGTAELTGAEVGDSQPAGKK